MCVIQIMFETAVIQIVFFLFQYDRTISETQDAYMKILESSRALLSVVKQEAQELPNVKNQQRWVSIFC